MRTFIYALTIILLSQPSIYASNWMKITSNSMQTIYFDNESLIINDNLAQYWIKIITHGQGTDKLYMVSNCSDGTIAEVVRMSYNSSNKLINKENNYDYSYNFERVIPGSISELVHKRACSIIAEKTSKWQELIDLADKASKNNDLTTVENALCNSLVEAELLVSNNLGESYIIESASKLAKFYENLKMYSEATYLNKYIMSVSNKNSDIYSITQMNIYNIQYKIDEIQRERERMAQQRALQETIQASESNRQADPANHIFNVINGGLNAILGN